MKRFGFILFVLFVIYFIFLIRQDIIDNLGLKKEKQGVAKSIQQEEELFKELQKRMKDFKRAGYIEKLARIRLGLIKKGETAYKVIGR
ncbi:MAG: septum formation initiator family protein [Candidatus Margulisiibacteriota bacterium]